MKTYYMKIGSTITASRTPPTSTSSHAEFYELEPEEAMERFGWALVNEESER